MKGMVVAYFSYCQSVFPRGLNKLLNTSTCNAAFPANEKVMPTSRPQNSVNIFLGQML